MLDMIVAATAPALLLFTHEDRPLDRAHLSVEGLDSGVIVLRASGAARRGAAPFDDPGPGKRAFVNLGERAAPVDRAGGRRERRRGGRSRSWARAATTC